MRRLKPKRPPTPETTMTSLAVQAVAGETCGQDSGRQDPLSRDGLVR
jgi:hypothetical protein